MNPQFIDSTIKVSNPKFIYKLSGKWNFTTEDKLKNKKDNKWEKINVPGYWINSGYTDHNIGWYSIDFILTDKFQDKDMAIKAIEDSMKDVDMKYVDKSVTPAGNIFWEEQGMEIVTVGYLEVRDLL
jgi:hypothetical protein